MGGFAFLAWAVEGVDMPRLKGSCTIHFLDSIFLWKIRIRKLEFPARLGFCCDLALGLLFDEEEAPVLRLKRLFDGHVIESRTRGMEETVFKLFESRASGLSLYGKG